MRDDLRDAESGVDVAADLDALRGEEALRIGLQRERRSFKRPRTVPVAKSTRSRSLILIVTWRVRLSGARRRTCGLDGGLPLPILPVFFMSAYH